MSEKRKVSEPKLPDIQKCPRCGNPILIGDIRCSTCGYSVETNLDRLKSQPPVVMTSLLFALGVMIALAGITVKNNYLSFFLLLLGGGLIVSGGLYYAFDLFILNADDRREPLRRNNVLGVDLDFLMGNRRKKD